MKILLATSELSPLVKTGGLADMVSSLAVALSHEGIEVAIALPYYSKIEAKVEDVCEISIPIGADIKTGSIKKTVLLNSSIPVFLLSQPEYFDRNGIYSDHTLDYHDNLFRYTFFCRGVLELIRQSIFKPDILHANDWQTALLPVYLKTEYNHLSEFKTVQSIFTIHNMAYQGSFPAEQYPFTGIGWEHFHMEALEFYNQINFLKGGIVFADSVTTVSPTYSKEIQTPEFGCGLEGVLQNRNGMLTGVLNGVDYSIWSPENDLLISHPYNKDNAPAQKQLNKQTLRKMFHLPELPANRPVFGVVARLVAQKGLDLLAEILPKLVELDSQVIILGSGEIEYEKLFLSLQQKYPKHCAVMIAYNEKAAHQIEAGSDIFLMPSRYEPCGLNQMYSLRYGSIPIVHKTGGLADTIFDVDIDSNGNGFSFDEPTPDALLATCKRAMAYYQQQDFWHKLIRRAMEQDYSWNSSAKQYIQIYEQVTSTLQAV